MADFVIPPLKRWAVAGLKRWAVAGRSFTSFCFSDVGCEGDCVAHEFIRGKDAAVSDFFNPTAEAVGCCRSVVYAVFFRASVARVGGAEPTNLFAGLKSVVIRLQSARVDLSAK